MPRRTVKKSTQRTPYVMQFHRDKTIEKWLTDHGIPFEYEEKVLASSIRMSHSGRVQPRVDIGSRGLVVEVVKRYARSIAKQESTWPPMVFNKEGKWYTPLQGNHRKAAGDSFDTPERMEAGFSSMNVEFYAGYVISTDDEAILWDVATQLNRFNGRPPTEEENLLSALDTHLKFPRRTLQGIAEDFGIKTGTLETHARANVVCDKLAEYGVDASILLEQPSTLKALGKLLAYRQSLIYLTELTIEYGLRISDIDGIASHVRSAETDEERREILDVYYEKLVEREKVPVKRRTSSNQAKQFCSALMRVDNLLTKYPSYGHLGVTTNSEKAKLKDLCIGVVAKMEGLLE